MPYLQADGLFGDNPGLGELARLRSLTALIQPRLVRLTDAADQLRPFFTADRDLEMEDDARASLTDDAAGCSTRRSLPWRRSRTMRAGPR